MKPQIELESEMPNIELISKLQEVIKKKKHTNEKAKSGFCMVVWRHPCGTPSCIGGFLAALIYPNADYHNDISLHEHLGVNMYLALELFYPHGAAKPYSEITPDDAVQALEHLKDGTCMPHEVWRHIR
jgi:hypothetical protein